MKTSHRNILLAAQPSRVPEAAAVRAMLVTDLDGTLLTDQRTFLDKDLDALSGLQRKGIATAIATGRSVFSWERLLSGLGLDASQLPFDYLISSTGAAVTNISNISHSAMLRSWSLSEDEVHRVVDILEQNQLDFMVHKAVPDTREFLYCRSAVNQNPDFYRRLAMYRETGRECSTELLKTFGAATEVLCIVPQELGAAMTRMLTTLLAPLSVIRATSPLDGQSCWIEIFAPLVSKSHAVQWLTTELGIPREHVCAVGNDYNDLDMLRWSGSAYVVANSPVALANEFNAVASNNMGGVAAAVLLWLSTLQVEPRTLQSP